MEEGLLVGVLVVAMLVAVGAVAYIAWRAAVRRTETLLATARSLGLEFDAGPLDVPSDWQRLDGLDDGHSRVVKNITHGTYRSRVVKCFDYEFVTGSGKDEQRHKRGILLARVPVGWPRVTVVPESWGHKFSTIFGVEEVDFESQEFSDRFWVRTEERRFAYDVIDARMMDWLLAAGPSQWEIRGGLLCIWESKPFKAEALTEKLDLIVEFLERVPKHVWNDTSRGALA